MLEKVEASLEETKSAVPNVPNVEIKPVELGNINTRCDEHGIDSDIFCTG